MAMNEHTILIKKDGTVWGCGKNDKGQLCLGNTTSLLDTITKLPIDNVRKIYSGNNYTILLKKDGTVWGCGHNNYGQLGLGHATTPVLKVTKIPIDNVMCIYCGSEHTIFLKKDGTVWGCGYNGYRQLGLGENSPSEIYTPTELPINNIKSVYCGYNHTIFLKKDGTVWCCGGNGSYQLGLGSNATANDIVQIQMTDIKNISCGSNHTVFLKKDGTVWGCGESTSGQLGTTGYAKTPILLHIENVKCCVCGWAHTIFLKKDGTVWGCGKNGLGQLGLSNTTSQIFSITQIRIDNVKTIHCGHSNTIIIKKDGTIFGSGDNKYGQLGLSYMNNTVSSITKMDISDIKKSANEIDTVYYSILKDNGEYKTISNGKIVSLGANIPDMLSIKNNGIMDLNDLLFSNEETTSLICDITDNFEVIVYSEDNDVDEIIIDFSNQNTIVKSIEDIPITGLKKINSVNVITQNTGVVRVAISFDRGITWKTFRNNDWVDIDVDTRIEYDGISLETLNKISSEHWDLALINNTIRFSFYLQNLSSSDDIAVDSLIMNVDMEGVWGRAEHNVDYDYMYSSNSNIDISLLKNGTYKINY